MCPNYDSDTFDMTSLYEIGYIKKLNQIKIKFETQIQNVKM